MQLNDVLQIIKACRAEGVSKLRYGELELELGAAPTPTFPEDPQLAKSNLLENELRVKESDLENLRLEDPLQYEELIRSRELEDKSTGEIH